MADSILHFAVGMTLGTALALWPVARVWKSGVRLAEPFAWLLLLSYSLGLWAVVPNLLGRLGCPQGFCSGWWMNIFVLHPIIDAAHPGGMLAGALLTLACFGLQYCLLVAAVAYRVRHP